MEREAYEMDSLLPLKERGPELSVRTADFFVKHAANRVRPVNLAAIPPAFRLPEVSLEVPEGYTWPHLRFRIRLRWLPATSPFVRE